MISSVVLFVLFIFPLSGVWRSLLTVVDMTQLTQLEGSGPSAVNRLAILWILGFGLGTVFYIT